MIRNVSVVSVYSAPNCCDTHTLLKNAGFGSEWDTLYFQVFQNFFTPFVVKRGVPDCSSEK